MSRKIMCDSIKTPYGVSLEITYSPLDDARKEGGKIYHIDFGKKHSIQLALNKAGKFENNFLANLAEKDRGYTVPKLTKRSKNGMLTVWEWPEEPKKFNLDTSNMDLKQRLK